MSGCIYIYDRTSNPGNGGNSEEVRREKIASMKKAIYTIKRALMDAINQNRKERESKYDVFFKSVGYGKEILEKFKLIKIYPKDFPADLHSTLSNR